MARLEKAIAFAAQAHSGQIDKGGEPYILHPLRVMQACRSEYSRITAVLHDVQEDCGVDNREICCLFGIDVARAVDALTKRRGEDYSAFILRAKANLIAREVKAADLADNMLLGRLGREPTVKDLVRQQKYRDALICLQEPSA